MSQGLPAIRLPGIGFNDIDELIPLALC